MGQRVRNVMSELSGEKIDIIDYDEDPARFVANALSPAKVVSVTVIDEAARAARVVVPDFQLSLAIGKEGQNARLAARLTGWRIDIRSDAAPAPDGADGRRRTAPSTRGGSAARDSVCGDGDGRLSRDPARDFGSRAPSHRSRRTGANVHRMPKARAGRRTASSGRCARRGRRIMPSPLTQRVICPGGVRGCIPTSSAYDAAIRRRAFVRALRITGSPDTSAVVEYVQHRWRTTRSTRQQNR